MDYLEYLAHLLSCEYLSDLRFRALTPKERQRILALDVNMFTLFEYQEAARYLLQSPSDFPSATAARLALVDHMTQLAPL